MNIIKFCGKNKTNSVKKAVSFFYDNYEDIMKLEIFLAKCRVQGDKKTIYFYPDMNIDLKKFKELKKKQKKK
jgi:hypothetical protein